MDFSSITTFFTDHSFELVILLLIAVWFLFSQYRKYYDSKKAKDEPEQPAVQPVYPPTQFINADSLYFDKAFEGVDTMEMVNLELMKEMRNKLDKEIKQNQEQTNSAIKRHNELIEITTRLRNQYPILVKQRKWFDDQIHFLEQNGCEQNDTEKTNIDRVGKIQEEV